MSELIYYMLEWPDLKDAWTGLTVAVYEYKIVQALAKFFSRRIQGIYYVNVAE